MKCPNCGAPVVGSKCEYCGTVFDNEKTTHEADDYYKLAMQIKLAKQIEELDRKSKELKLSICMDKVRDDINNRMMQMREDVNYGKNCSIWKQRLSKLWSTGRHT